MHELSAIDLSALVRREWCGKMDLFSFLLGHVICCQWYLLLRTETLREVLLAKGGQCQCLCRWESNHVHEGNKQIFTPSSPLHFSCSSFPHHLLRSDDLVRLSPRDTFENASTGDDSGPCLTPDPVQRDYDIRAPRYLGKRQLELPPSALRAHCPCCQLYTIPPTCCSPLLELLRPPNNTTTATNLRHTPVYLRRPRTTARCPRNLP